MPCAQMDITPEMLLTLFRGRYEVVAHAIPMDTTFQACTWDEPRQCLVLILAHPDFADVPAGALLPRIEAPHVRRLE